MKEKKKKERFEDDGRTVVNMNVEGFSWYRPTASRTKPEKKKKRDPDAPTQKETWAIIKAAYKAYLPYFLTAAGVFTLLFVLAYFWLR